MKITVTVPEYDGNGIDVIWESGSEYSIYADGEDVVIRANKQALVSLAKQMLYMAHNDLPKGSHVHYDNFFTNSNGKELIIEAHNK